MDRDTLEMFEHLQGELLLQSLALKALFRAQPHARDELSRYIDATQADGGFDTLAPITRESLLNAARALVGRR